LRGEAIRLLVFMTSTPFARKTAVTMSEFVQSWKNTKAYTIEVAEAMPAESYGFRPALEEFNFARQMIHIAYANYAWFVGVMGESTEIADFASEDKPAVLAYLRDTFDFCIAALDRITPEQLDKTMPSVGGRKSGSGRDALLNMYMHVAHHRGQAIVYLRLNGIKPPEYRY
jgi:uncharacterized damage-inducible protein DinB